MVESLPAYRDDEACIDGVDRPEPDETDHISYCCYCTCSLTFRQMRLPPKLWCFLLQSAVHAGHNNSIGGTFSRCLSK